MKSHTRTSFIAIALALLTVTANASASNAKYKKSRFSGLEFGMGVPLVTPLTGYNIFVGYVNKDASTILGRRFGVRADFTISTPLQLNGTISKGTDKADKIVYDIDANGKILGINLNQSKFTNKKTTIDFKKDDDFIPGSFDGISASFSLKNQNFGLLIDFYPFADTWFLGGLRFSGGYYMGDLDLNANVDFNKDVDFSYRVKKGQKDYIYARIPAGSHLGVKYHWAYSGPYAGFGFDLGIWHGFKFFIDAGVVFAHAPHIGDHNIDDENFVIKSCYKINDDGTGCKIDDMMELVHGIKTKPDTEQLLGTTVSQFLTTNNTDGKLNDVITVINNNGGNIQDAAQLGKDVMDFLNGQSIGWIDKLVDTKDPSNHAHETDLASAVNTLKSELGKKGSDTKDKFDKAWDDYQKSKNDLFKDVNKALDDYGIVPMIKFGFMYRF